MEDIREYSESLQRSFRELERALAECSVRSNGSLESGAVINLELEGKVSELTVRNEALEHELVALRHTYDGLLVTYNELLGRLNAAIELVKSILERE
ncbi:hypothetical protein ANPL_01150 [Anaplasma platys]|uniref:Uncharacterized protein n=1 Tax=Anaplasma platys TaxID=949 RepID=A0A858PXM2_9RICK|nr:hypothetical protein ANPL_01150 [Anaplasma platys]